MPTTYAIPNGATQFAATTYTGNGTSQTVTNGASTSGVTFQPDFVWYKDRSVARDHGLFDAVRGTTKYLGSNLTNQESTTSGVDSFNSNGFTLGSNVSGNAITDTFVAWQWKASNAVAVSNTNGTITSQVSANQTAGFSIVTYAGNLTTTPSAGSMPTVGHGLNAVPKLIISKSRTVAGADSGAWAVFSSLLATDSYLRLNTTSGTASVSGGGGGTMVAPTNSVFSTPYISGSNVNANNYVAYCWSEINGYSKFGTYVGDTTNLPFVYLGFRPRFLMVKSTTLAGTDWAMWDTSRDTYNIVNYQIIANGTATGATPTADIDILSNGFKARRTANNFNASGQTYIYAAFAENPFKYANAR